MAWRTLASIGMPLPSVVIINLVQRKSYCSIHAYSQLLHLGSTRLDAIQASMWKGSANLTGSLMAQYMLLCRHRH